MSDRNLGERETNLRGNAIGKTRRSNKPGEPTEQHRREETTKKAASEKKILHYATMTREQQNWGHRTKQQGKERRDWENETGKARGATAMGRLRSATKKIGETQQSNKSGRHLERPAQENAGVATNGSTRPERRNQEDATKKTPQARETDLLRNRKGKTGVAPRSYAIGRQNA